MLEHQLMASEYIPYDGPVVTHTEAKALGLKYFFVGKPCSKGHVSERYLRGSCVQCGRDRATAHYQALTPSNREDRNTSSAAWKAANRDKVNATARKYDRAHPDAHKKWKAENLDKVNEARRAYYQSNAEKEKIACRLWAEKNPDAVRTKTLNYQARKKGAEGNHTAKDIKALYAAQSGACVYCRADLNEGFHVDHIVPLARGGSNWITNLQLTCGYCNRSKGAIDPIEFERRRAKRLAAKET
jgi:5-methylcytosine-specific restriction endonuclease McrA